MDAAKEKSFAALLFVEAAMEAVLRPEDVEKSDWLLFGEMLDEQVPSLGDDTVAMFLAWSLLRVRARSGALVRLEPNRAQREFERAKGRENIILKARQMGLTTWVAARFFLRTITRPGTMTLQVAHTQDSAEEIFRIVRRFYDCLPEDLRTGVLRTSKASSTQLVFPELDSTYRVATAGDKNAGRGLTVQNMHLSELARWPGDVAETLAGLRAAMAPDAELVMESTPMGASGVFYEQWCHAEAAGITQHFFPWWWERSYVGEAVPAESLSDEERELMLREGLSLEQIAFRRRKHGEMKQGGRGLALQEYAEDAETCFRVSGEPIFEMDAVESRLRALREPGLRKWNGALSVWYPPQRTRQYVVAVDPAGGGAEGDWSVAQVLDLKTGWQCAEFAAHVGGRELADRVCELAAWYGDAPLVIERNNHGSGILAYAVDHFKYKNVYEQGGQPGWLTSAVTRPYVLGKLAAALVDAPENFNSRELLMECRSFVRLPNGNTGARSGAHDDRVMAMAIALGAREEMLLRA